MTEASVGIIGGSGVFVIGIGDDGRRFQRQGDFGSTDGYSGVGGTKPEEGS